MWKISVLAFALSATLASAAENPPASCPSPASIGSIYVRPNGLVEVTNKRFLRIDFAAEFPIAVAGPNCRKNSKKNWTCVSNPPNGAMVQDLGKGHRSKSHEYNRVAISACLPLR